MPRQVGGAWETTNNLKNIPIMTKADIVNEIAKSTGAVSYTHLDVYKRQEQ